MYLHTMVLTEMFYTFFWILTILDRIGLADGDTVAHPRIFPSSPVIERGSTLEVFCSLGKKLYPYKNASHIIWTLNDDIIKKENYIIVNESVSRVVIHNFTAEKACVKCFVDSPLEKQHVAHAEVKSDFPPKAPENISCIFYDMKNFTCNWTPIRKTYIDTDYTLYKRNVQNGGSFNESYHEHKCGNHFCFSTTRNQDLNCTYQHCSCSSKNGSCSFYPSVIPVNFPGYCLQVKANNSLGEVMSECIVLYPQEIIKFDPPEITKIQTIPGIKQMLTVTWKVPYSFGHLNCQIRYNAPTKHHSEVENCAMGDSGTNSINLTNLWDSTNYTVEIQCAHSQSKFWSEWSASKTGITEEQAPMKVDLWRVIESHQPTGNRIVHLLWKKCEEFPSSGIILDYTIKYSTKNSSSSEITSNETVTCNLMGDAYQISVVARNAAGLSPEAVLRIPSIHEEGKDQGIVNLSAFPVREEMVVEWGTSGFNVTDYVIEWYDELETDIYKRSWKYVNVTNWTSPKGAFEAFKCYNISVYPVYKGEIQVPRSVRVYFHEKSPSKGPKPEVKKFGKHEAIITWNEVAKADANGDIVNYTVFYRPEGGEELGETVNAKVLQYHLKSLQAETKYIVRVMASTRAGGTCGDKIDFITNGFSIVENILINIVVGIFMLSLLIVGSLWILKKYSLKNICWPKIPHPTISGCSEISQKVMLREPPFEQDTKSPDVISILEVDTRSENDDDDDPILENDFSQVDVTAEDVDCRRQMLCSTEHEDLKLLPEAIPSLGQDLSGHTLSAVEGCKDHENEQVQGQANWMETTEFNTYLKNSVPTREFLFCENSNQTTRESENPTRQLIACIPDDIGQPYIALNTFELFFKA